jgi:hypothetical protein
MKKTILITAIIVLGLIVFQLITGPGIIATSKVGGQYIVLKQVLTYIALTFIIIGLFVSLYCYFYNQSKTKLAFILPVVGSALLMISNPYTLGYYSYSLLVVTISTSYLLFKRKS